MQARNTITLIIVTCVMMMLAIGSAQAGTIYHPGTYATIQLAVGAAMPGDTIEISSGTYAEQVTIDKSINLVGVGITKPVIQAPLVRSGIIVQDSVKWDYIIAACPTSGTIDVKIQNIDIDANGQSKQADPVRGLVGAFFRDVNGTNAGLYDCDIHGFQQVEYESWGVKVYGDSNLNIKDNNIAEYTRDGINVFGDYGSGLDPSGNIIGNNVAGSALCLNGIEVIGGATAVVKENMVSNHTRPGIWAGVGILLDGSDSIIIEANKIENCFYGLVLWKSNSNIVKANEFHKSINRHIQLHDSDNNSVTANTISGTTLGTEDCAIGFADGSTGNNIGGSTASEGNSITLADIAEVDTSLQYAVYIEGSVEAGSNTIQNNTIAGGKRSVQVDGGNTGTTTVKDNNISGGSFGGVSFNGGNADISGNTLTDTKRPIEFWGAINFDVTGNEINGSYYDAINVGYASGSKMIRGNTIYNIPDWQFAIHGRSGAAGMTIDGNEIKNSHRGIGIEPGCTGVSITNNRIHDNRFSAIELSEATYIIKCNYLENNERGIETNSPITANCNSILYHTYGGIILHNAGPHNVENNWWGDASGPNVNGTGLPGTGTVIQTNGHSIDYDPWTILQYTGATTFANTTNVILKAKFGDSIVGGMPGIPVTFMVSGDSVPHIGITDSNGVASVDIGVKGVGVYNVAASVGCIKTSAMIAVYDPTAGFVTGGGWINSPTGAYTPNDSTDENYMGKATFGFVSKYKKGTSIPEGNTQFQFKAGGLNFNSTSYDWLVVAGGQAKFKGTGTITGWTGEYIFMLTAVDGAINGGADKFRIKIIDKISGAVIYDNNTGSSDLGFDATEIGGGSIVIHK